MRTSVTRWVSESDGLVHVRQVPDDTKGAVEDEKQYNWYMMRRHQSNAASLRVTHEDRKGNLSRIML